MAACRIGSGAVLAVPEPFAAVPALTEADDDGADAGGRAIRFSSPQLHLVLCPAAPRFWNASAVAIRWRPALPWTSECISYWMPAAWVTLSMVVVSGSTATE